LAREDSRRNELLLLLPPPAAYGVYTVAGLWMGVCFYLIMLHGLRFSPELEVAWVIASVVAALQELLIQQVGSCVRVVSVPVLACMCLCRVCSCMMNYEQIFF
jgi:hypothetical protein